MRALCQLSTYDGKRSAVVLNLILSNSSWCNIYVPLFLSILKWNYKMGYCLSRKISMYLRFLYLLLSNCTVFNKELLYCITHYSQVRAASSISNYVTLKWLDVFGLNFVWWLNSTSISHGTYNKANTM